ncbi:MAG: 4-hydroxythreonine-4-phosphate dehydrogenase [Lysobacterales bacterium]|jgi:4-hydroxythreonine-4-phosphate dehydrogenase
MRQINIGITLGDPAGIGAEVVAKALAKRATGINANFTIIGNQLLFDRYFKKSKNITFKSLSSRKHKAGKSTKYSGQESIEYLDQAIRLLKDKKIDRLVTAPICKEAICLTQPKFTGHTEYLADAFKSRNVGMFFVAPKLRVQIATRHIPLKDVPNALTQKLIQDNLNLMASTLKDLYGIKCPTIAVCGLNPHAGESGIIGDDEIKTIIPAINKVKGKGYKVLGPLPADTLFQTSKFDTFDAVLAMYHDQGLIPIKTLYFDELVNLTIGLPIIRTSPAHGTAFDIAGKDKANPASMNAAIKLAIGLKQ